ncbi:MAG: dCTP deaminase [Enterobacteriaceae bacterium]
MILCDYDIKNYILKKKIIISPKPDFNNINGIKLDFCLGNKFYKFNKKIKHIDLRKSKKIFDNLEEIYVKDNKYFKLYPNSMVLSVTFESFTLPDNLFGILNGNSSMARLGLNIHITSQIVDPGWSGNIVLECYNMNNVNLLLRPKTIIGSIIFNKLDSSVKIPYNLKKNSKFYKKNNIIIT